MRLFIAILFNEEIKDTLNDAIKRFKIYARGNFTLKENLHLTVNFIGETHRVTDVQQAMERAVNNIKAEPFQLQIMGMGRFKGREGDIYWVGVEKEDTLWRLQEEIVRELTLAGFDDIEDREYKPHLTLGRKVVVNKDFVQKDFETGIIPMKMNVERISLMKSEQIRGKLVYTEIYCVNMGETV